MHLSSFSVRNIKCFEEASLTFPGNSGNHAGWHVLLGINGTGKSTLLQAMALAMLGPVSSARLLKQPSSWVREGADYGEVRAALTTTMQDTLSGGVPPQERFDAHLLVTGAKHVSVGGEHYVEPQVALRNRRLGKILGAGPYSSRSGWFSAGYGPFRRLTGPVPQEDADIHHGQGREARHHTLFRESAALTECEEWLASLYSRSIDPALPGREQASQRLDAARRIIDGLLPGGARIDRVTSRGVALSTPCGANLALSQLSDGYRSFLALTIDLLRRILDGVEVGANNPRLKGDRPALDTEGVVLIDEVDAHLHPTWQRDIGVRMCEVFPHMQFIVSSHSPLVAQAAKRDRLFMTGIDREGRVVVQPASKAAGDSKPTRLRSAA